MMAAASSYGFDGPGSGYEPALINLGLVIAATYALMFLLLCWRLRREMSGQRAVLAAVFGAWSIGTSVTVLIAVMTSDMAWLIWIAGLFVISIALAGLASLVAVLRREAADRAPREP